VKQTQVVQAPKV